MGQPRRAWSWRPSGAAWFRNLGAATARWDSRGTLQLDPGPIAEAVQLAAERKERWLYHPCVNAVMLPGDAQRLKRDLQFAVWVAAHAEPPPARVTLTEPVWLWAPGGGAELAPGVHELHALGDRVATDRWPWRIAVDVWCHTTGLVAEHSWAALPPAAVPADADRAGAIGTFLRALDVLAQRFPACTAWLTDVVKVAVPLYGSPGHTRSGSAEALPGLVKLTFGDELDVAELLVHEAAHQYLFLLRAGSPLSDPRDGATYSSPLRPDPRPLGAVLTAYHAIVYMATLYDEIARAGVLRDGRPEHRHRELCVQLAAAERTLATHRHRLTALGCSVFDATAELAAACAAPESVAC